MRWWNRFFAEPSRAVRPVRSQARLRAEELEPRWNPSTSTNWSGYAVTTAAGAVTAVSGSWTVPTVTGTGTAYSAVWVGIDGATSNTVEQTGILADVVNGVAQYSAWYEMYPSAMVPLNLAIHPDDKITASVSYSGGQFTLTITDLSDKAGSNSVTEVESAPNAQRSSAEWIVEAPASNSGVLPLANFGTVTFTSASATIGGTTGPIDDSAWSSEATAINMVSSRGVLEASTSALNGTGDGFTVTYAAASPPVSPPPASPPSPPVSPPPVSPPSPPAVSPPPATGTVATTTSMVGTVDPYTRVPTVTLTVTVSPSVPAGSTVELLSGTTVLGYGRVHSVGGVDEVSFDVMFFQTGTYTFTAVYLGAGQYASSASNTVTVTVTPDGRDWQRYGSALIAPTPPQSSSDPVFGRRPWW
jgi:hypothetical protein